MSTLTAGWQRVRAWFIRRRRELRLSVRMTVGGMLAYLIAQLLHLPQGYWAVFAAVIVTETSVGGSVHVALNWMAGTLGGAIYGGAVAAFLVHIGQSTGALELLIGLAPLALMAALYPRLRVAPTTAIIVLATINSSSMGPLQSALDRMLEIGLGSFIGLGVSLLVLPSRAHNLVVDAVCRTLDNMARLLTALIAGFGNADSVEGVQPIHLDILAALSHLDDVVDEAKRERATRLTNAPDPAPLPRTLHRIRNDLVMIGRATPAPFPEPLPGRLQPPFVQAAQAVVAFFRDSAAALKKRQPLPPLAELDAAFDHFTEVLLAMRGEQLIRGQNAEIAGRIFALSFAFQQLRVNLKDFAARIAERDAAS